MQLDVGNEPYLSQQKSPAYVYPAVWQGEWDTCVVINISSAFNLDISVLASYQIMYFRLQLEVMYFSLQLEPSWL